jgi:acyl-CoA synthetase (AMP-forming)/AMP-acid ligase II
VGHYLLGEILHESATRFAGRPSLTIAPSGETWTYTEFERLTNRFAHGLRARVPALPSHVAIMLENGVQYLAASYALKKLGPVEVSINRAFRGLALARMIRLTGAPILIS